MRKIIKLLIASSALLHSPLYAITFHGGLFGYVGTSVLNGFVQVPQGGSFGSTSYRRPTLDELNIHHSNFYTIGALAQLNHYDITYNYSRYAPRGKTQLKNILNTHGKYINAGSSLSTLIKYDLHQLSVGRRFDYEHWIISPFVQSNFLKFHYEYSAFPIRGARTYNVTGFNIGLNAIYQFTPTLFGDLQITPPLPVANFTYADFELGLSKKINMRKNTSVSPRAAIGLQQLDYKDNQAVPNHIRLQNAPYVMMGFQVQIH
ncbi:MAG: hypothetical protein JSR17_09915 [Proteobacteria bacterium]|nr:hypothetical protein [Pseudomonadota bacterium]